MYQYISSTTSFWILRKELAFAMIRSMSVDMLSSSAAGTEARQSPSPPGTTWTSSMVLACPPRGHWGLCFDEVPDTRASSFPRLRYSFEQVFDQPPLRAQNPCVVHTCIWCHHLMPPVISRNLAYRIIRGAELRTNHNPHQGVVIRESRCLILRYITIPIFLISDTHSPKCASMS